MYLTQVNIICGLTKAEYFQLRELCFFSNCLYNFALYNVRQRFFKDKTYVRFEANYHECKDNDNYKLLQANIIRDGYLTVPKSRTYTSVLNSHRIKIKVPARLLGKKIKEVKIIPLYKGRAFKIAYCYEVNAENLKLNRDNALAIDIGLDNLATCVTNFGTSFIMDGRKIKHINRNWNKRRAYLQSILMKQGRYSSKLLERITLKRNNRVDDCLKKTARYIINFCIANDMGTVICGYNTDFKRGLYKSKSGRLINADVNGAANILRKSKQNLNFERLCVGLLGRPLRIRVA